MQVNKKRKDAGKPETEGGSGGLKLKLKLNKWVFFFVRLVMC